MCELLRNRHDRGRYASIVVVAEGAEPKEGSMRSRDKVYDQFGHVRLGGVAIRGTDGVFAESDVDR